MKLILDDYNKLFKITPELLKIDLNKIFNEYSTFDRAKYEKLQQAASSLLSAIDDYKVIAYTTGSESVQYATLWSINSGKYDQIVKVRHVYNGNFLLHHTNHLFPIKFPVVELSFSESEAEMLDRFVNIHNSVIILEPTFSDYFVIFSVDFFISLSNSCKENNNILILDEIRSGLFRLGSMSFAHQVNIAPDVICLGKGLGLGLPISLACFKKSTFSKINWHEVEVHRTSQSLNSFSLTVANHLIDYFASSDFIMMLTNCHNYIYATFSKMKAECKQVQSIAIKGACVRIHLTHFPRNLSVLTKLFTSLRTKGIQCRFPERNRLIFVFPYDSSKDEIDHAYKTAKNCIESSCIQQAQLITLK